MKKNEVVIGMKYIVKVSGKLQTVKITNESPYGGWDGLNVETNRRVRIKTAARLRKFAESPTHLKLKPAPAPKAAAPVAPTGRDQAIAALGMKPEEKTADGRYAATTGELVKWAREASDVFVSDQGSVVAFTPMSEAGKAFLTENVSSEGWQWLGKSLVVETRAAGDLIDVLRENGLRLS